MISMLSIYHDGEVIEQITAHLHQGNSLEGAGDKTPSGAHPECATSSVYVPTPKVSRTALTM